MNQNVSRLAYLLVGWLSIGVVYFGTTYLQGEPILLEPSLIDRLIPFTPHAIWFYLSFFIIIPFCFFYAPYVKVRWMSLCFIVISLIAGGCFLALPTTMSYPIDRGTSLSSRLLAQLVRGDITPNCFPSLHVALTIIVVWGSFDARRFLASLLLILWGIAICLSIILLRRHVFIDFMGGALLAIVVGGVLKCYLIRLASSVSYATQKKTLI